MQHPVLVPGLIFIWREGTIYHFLLCFKRNGTYLGHTQPFFHDSEKSACLPVKFVQPVTTYVLVRYDVLQEDRIGIIIRIWTDTCPVHTYVRTKRQTDRQTDECRLFEINISNFPVFVFIFSLEPTKPSSFSPSLKLKLLLRPYIKTGANCKNLKRIGEYGAIM